MEPNVDLMELALNAMEEGRHEQAFILANESNRRLALAIELRNGQATQDRRERRDV